jgi:hypothetical protein
VTSGLRKSRAFGERAKAPSKPSRPHRRSPAPSQLARYACALQVLRAALLSRLPVLQSPAAPTLRSQTAASRRHHRHATTAFLELIEPPPAPVLAQDYHSTRGPRRSIAAYHVFNAQSDHHGGV